MLLKACVACVFLVIGIQCDSFPDTFRLGDPSTWDLIADETRHHIREVDAIPKDREPLAPNYKEPKSRKIPEIPVLKPKSRPSYDPFLLPGGVIDIPAPGSSSDDVDLTSTFERPNFPFGNSGFPGGDDDFSSFPGLGRPGSFFSGLLPGFGAGDVKPWWKGPNVCITREESTDDEDKEIEPKSTTPASNSTEDDEIEKVPNFFSTSISLSNCQETPRKYECITKINNHGVVKTFTVTYKCCYGYTRSSRATSGCDQKVDLKSLLQTIEDLGGKEFKTMIETHKLQDRLEANMTVFVPNDQALNDFNEKMIKLNDLDDISVAPVRRRRDVKQPISGNDLILNHMVKGFFDMAEMVNDELIFSENHNRSIRINNYPTQNYERLTTANCARVTKANNLAKNGIVHMIDGVIVPATQSVEEIVKEHKSLGSLRKVFESTDLFKKFNDDGHYTIFAPVDEAFEKLDPSTKQKVLNGDGCASSIIKHHITPHTVCSAAIIGNSTTHNVEGQVLNIERTTENKLIFENKAKIIETDIIGINGVIHLIDTLIIPPSAMHINEAMKNENLTKFEELIQKAGLVEEIDRFQNATIFVPSNGAIEKSDYLKEIGDDKNKLRDLIMYHTVQGQLKSCDMNNNDLLKSNDNGKSLRVNLYSTLPLFSNILNRATVNCARLIGFDEKTCGSVIHEVDKVLVPPTKNILEIIESDPKFSKLVQLLKGTEVEKILQDLNNSITLLAPTDETFAGIPEKDLKSLEENKGKANDVLKNHILTEVLCCAGVGPQTFGFNNVVPTMADQSLQVGRSGASQIRVGSAVVTKCDSQATNGIVHTVNKVLFPRRTFSPNVGYFFLDF